MPDDDLIGLPTDLPLVHRESVRLVVLDAHGDVLLFHTREPDHPRLGTWWELPGGGIDPGESYADTAIRELREESGLVVTPAQIGAPSWRRRATFVHRQRRLVQREVVMPVRLDVVAPVVDGADRLDYEVEDYFGFRWWPVAAVADATDRFYPGRLPRLLGGFLAGEQIDEPFEFWS